MTAESPTEHAHALGRAAEFFRERQTRPGVLGRRLLGRPKSDDLPLVEHLIRERRRCTRPDGSVDHSLVRTAWTAWELLQLDCPSDNAGVVRMVGFILTRADQPGRFGETGVGLGSDLRLGTAFQGGGFSPGTAEESIAPLAFPSGVVGQSELDARFAASCFALRTVLRAREDRRAPVRRHVESLFAIRDMWESWEQDWTPELVFCALGALAHAPLEYRDRLGEITAHVVRHQRDDGTWAGADLLHALDALTQIPTADAREAVRHAIPALYSSGVDVDVFAEPANEERALIVLRALRTAGR